MTSALHPEIEGFYRAAYEQRVGMIPAAIARSVHYSQDPPWIDPKAAEGWAHAAVRYTVLTAHCARQLWPEGS